MFHEVTIRFQVNYQKNKNDAGDVAQGILDYIKEYEESAIVFIEKPVLLDIEEIGIDCSSCRYCNSEEVCIGDRGNGIEYMVKHLCEFTGEEITPALIDFCYNYTVKNVS